MNNVCIALRHNVKIIRDQNFKFDMKRRNALPKLT